MDYLKGLKDKFFENKREEQQIRSYDFKALADEQQRRDANKNRPTPEQLYPNSTFWKADDELRATLHKIAVGQKPPEGYTYAQVYKLFFELINSANGPLAFRMRDPQLSQSLYKYALDPRRISAIAYIFSKNSRFSDPLDWWVSDEGTTMQAQIFAKVEKRKG